MLIWIMRRWSRWFVRSPLPLYLPLPIKEESCGGRDSGLAKERNHVCAGRDTCRLCNSTRLIPYLDLGQQPLANSFVASGELSETMPLRLVLCRIAF